MPSMRKTRKFVAAQRCVMDNDLQEPAGVPSHEELYGFLDDMGFIWDAGMGEWRVKRKEEMPEFAPDGVPGVVRVRVNANLDEMYHILQNVLTPAIESAGGRVVSASDYYPNTRKGTGVRQYLEVYLPIEVKS